jgi:hypothetical protein
MNFRSFSKEGQDKLVLTLNKEPGFFLDIGCADPVYGNNSFLLELLGWKGILFDYSRADIDNAHRYRVNPAVQCDAKTMDWSWILNEVKAPSVIDYISLDVDEANTTVIRNFPLDKYEFKIMTYEHDRYNSGDNRKKAAEEVLSKYPQYVRLLNNAKVQGLEWEDWWINKNYFDEKVLSKSAESMDWYEFIQTL